jgi:hypothetical protein
MNHGNDQRMEADEIIHVLVYRVIYQDKHLLYEDIWLFQHLHYHHLLDNWMRDLDVLDKIVLRTLD